MPIRVFLRDSPQRAIALATDTHVLIFRHSPSAINPRQGSVSSVNEGGVPRCIVEFSPWESQDMQGYRALSASQPVHGTLGLVTLNGDVFLCVVNGSRKVATIRPGETIQRIHSVEFHCLNSSTYDHLLNDQVNPFPTDDLDADGYDHGGHREPLNEHPCMALRKLLSGGSFYHSADFDLTKRLQDRPTEASTVAIDSLDGGFLWNTYMIQPLVDFRSRLSSRERQALDQSGILTSAIRGFASTVTVPASSSPLRVKATGMPSSMTLISRLSCRRAGTRFNARGIDDDGNVANFVETETIFATDAMIFSYVQCRGSVPIFWEQASGLPGQQKIQVTRSVEATQHAFDKHFQRLVENYGDVVAVNLLSDEKTQETQLTRQYLLHIRQSTLNSGVEKGGESEHKHVTAVNYDFHAETRGPNGYVAASGIRHSIENSALAFEYFLAEDKQEIIHQDGRQATVIGRNDILKQAGVFRTNCLDCLDRTNLVQTIISRMAFEIFLKQEGERNPTSDFWARHGTLWADNGDQLSKIYAGTGALKSSFTRSGKMSLAGTLADLRKSAQRFYINNVEDKGRQETMDMLLGRLIGQTPVHLYDPINDWVTSEVAKRSPEFTTSENINIWVGTFNLNGKTRGIDSDLSIWLCPNVEEKCRCPEIVAVAFQEIVELDVQQIMSTDPHRRQVWEEAVRKTLNANSQRYRGEDYVLLRGGQLVGASLSVYVRASVLPLIKNVEGAVKKTGLSGMAGNKGAVAIRMDFADTSICLVTAHLAAGFANYEERNQDYRTISTGLRFQRNRAIEDHKTIIWFGDFNYRIGMENERARQLIKKRDLGQLYENDQLNLQMVHGKCFPHYSEQTPTFLPTYKFNLGSDEYDTSDKARIPAWCDRILTRGDNLRPLYYDSAPLRFSDHRPVWGLFTCTISVVDQVKKDTISNELYTKRKTVVGNHTASQGAESDDESLYGYDSIEPGLPPASSDKRKWWLDNGMPARSTVLPPSAGHVPNPARPANPYTPSNEPDWVKVEKPNTPPSQSASLYSNVPVQSQRGVVPRKLAPPSKLTDAPTQPHRPANVDGVADERVHLKQTLRKPAPPKPNKPNLLRSESQQSEQATASIKPVAAPPPPEPRRTGTPAWNTAKSVLPPPPPRANGSVDRTLNSPPPQPPPPRKPVASSSADPGPPLPPRRQTGLMDDEGEKELKDWVPLKPQ
ncbi:Inositol-1,4,5-trisphosphate 5-phosphatase 1 [Lecanosticta acicola]|uniref:phosphoinositide 5-phosphatase n=1 Tax=Lecanosticta acicola TaxID=111012 RepID=A0AAI8YTB3_9PEZI|nr:Inositol-1,4,5-trisphosphate 5-phosphatase 1 [Lecanosticta acicola]